MACTILVIYQHTDNKFQGCLSTHRQQVPRLSTNTQEYPEAVDYLHDPQQTVKYSLVFRTSPRHPPSCPHIYQLGNDNPTITHCLFGMTFR
ncbi:unnamed protein product [Penicillium salamii]|nr:unnamed protein product [Penicillium salamii]CAG8025100.1 unnamed protein product [Penicillium salamii]CAG8178132.1 unnamed protein product [Penicillium salamii]CAG8213094.1 unnamed protein product [Penicillium salamii]CAG8425946.1 unnamed protein product [Penicillium salamii]